MMRRCYEPSFIEYPDYGARGITVCDRWMASFSNFLEDMGVRPEGKTLDRRDNDGDYSPSNCRWATRVEQNRNSRHNRILEHDGEALPMSVWAERFGVARELIRDRIDRYGWTVREAITGVRDPRPCEYCGNQFTPRRPLKTCCSKSCYNSRNRGMAA